MKTKSVPAIVMLSAGFVACVAGICAHMEVADFMKMLLIVLIVFYLLGGVVKIVLDRNFAGMNDEETTMVHCRRKKRILRQKRMKRHRRRQRMPMRKNSNL